LAQKLARRAFELAPLEAHGDVGILPGMSWVDLLKMLRLHPATVGLFTSTNKGF